MEQPSLHRTKAMFFYACFIALNCFLIQGCSNNPIIKYANIADTIFKEHEVIINYNYNVDSITKPTILKVSSTLITDSMVRNVDSFKILLSDPRKVDEHFNFPRFIYKDSVDFGLKHYSISGNMLTVDIIFLSMGYDHSIPYLTVDKENNLRFADSSSIEFGKDYGPSFTRTRIEIFIPPNFRVGRLIYNEK